jgi:hypothetical protein
MTLSTLLLSIRSLSRWCSAVSTLWPMSGIDAVPVSLCVDLRQEAWADIWWIEVVERRNYLDSGRIETDKLWPGGRPEGQEGILPLPVAPFGSSAAAHRAPLRLPFPSLLDILDLVSKIMRASWLRLSACLKLSLCCLVYLSFGQKNTKPRLIEAQR